MPKFEDYERDIENLSKRGFELYYTLYEEHGTAEDKANIPQEYKGLPMFSLTYEHWFSECVALLAQIAPERLDDFRALYAPKSTRREITPANYTLSDCLRGLRAKRYNDEIIYDPRSAARPLMQQATIIEGLKKRFKSTLFDIKTLVHADILNDELHAADELNKSGFQRGAGAVAGVVLEGHLGAVCERHQLTLRKKDPAISDLNDALKTAAVIDTVQWRFIQHLGDIRNKCDHKKPLDPTKDEVAELIDGVRKITKTVL